MIAMHPLSGARRTLWFGISAGVLLLFATLLIVRPSADAARPAPEPPAPAAVPAAAANAKIARDLQQQFQRDAAAPVRYIAVLTTQADVSNSIVDWQAKGRYVLDTLMNTAKATQPPVAAALAHQQQAGNVQQFKSYYIINAFQVIGNSASAQALALLPDVARLEVFPVVTVEPPPAQAPAPGAPNAIEWNVALVRAPQAWALGYTGAGVTVGSLDTGARHTHQALVGKYRGNLGGGVFDHNYNWWDSIRGTPVPYDNDGHGTHTIGTILGDDGGGNQIGVAPGARWISTNGIGTGTTDPDIIESGQWLLAPWDLNGQNPDPGKRPAVVSNSWGYGVNIIFPGCAVETFFRAIVQAWVAAGIFPSFSAGNGFPQGNRPPAAYPETFETGALSRQMLQASYSSAGPSCYDAGQHPQIMAGGGDFGAGLNADLVRSSYPTSDSAYEYLAGTSMAQPAVAGAVAILKQANPNLTLAQTWYVLTSTAYFSPTWGLRPNPQYGWGLLQMDAAVLAALALGGTPTPTVTGTPPTATPPPPATITRTPTPPAPTATPINTPVCVVSYQSSDVPKPIPDLPVAVPVTSSLTITNGPTIAGLEVINLQFAHTWAEDLDVYLISPLGTRVELFTDICGDSDLTQATTGFTLAQASGILIGEVCPPRQGTYRPEGNLAALIGQPSSGTWILEVTDDTFIDSGTLHAWGLRIAGSTGCPTATATATPEPRLVGHVTWQGRPAQPHPANQLPITLTLRMGGVVSTYPNWTTDASGTFTVSVSTLPAGTYQWWVKGTSWLATSGTVTLTGAPVTGQEMGLQRAGDVDNSNLVDITDFSLLRATFGLACGDPGYDGRADWTGDCLVDITDFTLHRNNFGQAGPPPP